MKSQSLLVLLEVLSTLGALGAALGAYNAARATRQAMEAQLFLQITQEYATPTLAQSLRQLRPWAAEHGEQFAAEFGTRLAAGQADAVAIDQAPRQVLFHFLTVLRLHEAGYVPEAFVQQAACAEQGLDVLVQIEEPMRQAFNPHVNTKEFDHLVQLCHSAVHQTAAPP